MNLPRAAEVADGAVRRLASHWGRLRLTSTGVELARTAAVVGIPIVQRVPGARIVVGEGAVLCSWGTWTALGIAHRLVLRAMRPGATLSIGEGTGISGGSVCAAESVEIGRYCLIGADVTICDTDFHPLDAAGRRPGARRRHEGACAPVRIGDDVFVGTRALILKGVHIGEGAVIGAGAVVTRSVPAGMVAAGNPARVVGSVAKMPSHERAAQRPERAG